MTNFNFATEFDRKIHLIYPEGIEWGIVGILTKNGNVYTLSFDSKILSGIFEIFCEPNVRSIAKDHHLTVEKKPLKISIQILPFILMISRIRRLQSRSNQRTDSIIIRVN